MYKHYIWENIPRGEYMFKNDYLHHRSEQFRQQVARRIDGSLTEEEFRNISKRTHSRSIRWWHGDIRQ